MESVLRVQGRRARAAALRMGQSPMSAGREVSASLQAREDVLSAGQSWARRGAPPLPPGSPAEPIGRPRPVCTHRPTCAHCPDSLGLRLGRGTVILSVFLYELSKKGTALLVGKIHNKEEKFQLDMADQAHGLSPFPLKVTPMMQRKKARRGHDAGNAWRMESGGPERTAGHPGKSLGE